jgi:hypothetical protein
MVTEKIINGTFNRMKFCLKKKRIGLHNYAFRNPQALINNGNIGPKSVLIIV